MEQSSCGDAATNVVRAISAALNWSSTLMIAKWFSYLETIHSLYKVYLFGTLFLNLFSVDDDLKFLLENDDSVRVEEIVKNYSDESSATLGHMEQQLEELLDTVTCLGCETFLFGSFAFFQHVGLVGQCNTNIRNVKVALQKGPSKATTDDNLDEGAVANEEEEGCEQGRPSSFTDFTEPPEDGDVEGDRMENATDLEHMVTVAGWKDVKKEKGDDLLCEMRF
ncbi:hypothetical protein FNV43_RR23148 [Rhamnella rubrinervis]|uniref:Uncharacterized protein n=1 Tax=Rhamnella rubrinervis TaxID=2594499 RepID=A0A8K0DST1_9ROSA|nr:hypothetical protein FNV43_RR23148 [Rhamnella rubrinervis]